MSPESAEWFATWWPIWAPLLLLILGGASTGVWAIVTRRDGERVVRKNPLPPTWPEMWARIDAQDTRIDALETSLLREQREKAEIIRHVKTLEAGYPNPPGPPPRPWAFVTN